MSIGVLMELLITVAAGLFWIVVMTRNSHAFRFNPDELHHFYYGWLIQIINEIHGRMWPEWLYYTLLGVALVMCIDDVWQHHKQVLYPYYHSPLHRVFQKIWMIF